MNNEIFEQLNKLAFKRSIPFCYSCYKEAPTGCCKVCGSDDLMRLVLGVGCEYGTDWVIKHILETELTAVDLEEEFEESIRQCYPEETQIGWMTFDTVKLMKENDPVGWRCAFSDYESEELSEGNIMRITLEPSLWKNCYTHSMVAFNPRFKNFINLADEVCN